MEVRDLAGNTVHEGDLIAGAFRSSTVASLRLGTVLGLSERGNKLVMRVKWDTESGYGNGARNIDVVGAIEVGLLRFVKVEA